jgi:hypothetical protein
MTLKDTPNATFLQVSEDGLLPLDLQDGQPTAPSGQAVPPVSLTPQRVSKKAKTMSATYGLHGSASSASVALQQSMESRLQTLLPTGGLTMFIKGWKQKATPLGRQYCQLAVSARPISETDCGLWLTPRANEVVEPAGQAAKRLGDRRPTTACSLGEQAQMAMWATPRSCEWKGAGQKIMRNDGKMRNDTLMFQAERFGPERVGQGAPTENIGSLNPAFPCWLMGFSTAALFSMHLAMQSFRKSRQSL